MTGEHVPAPVETFDEATYLAALQTLGVSAPAGREGIQQAYRERARRFHPDRFQTDVEREEATRRIQEINGAYRYAVTHWKGYQVARRWGGSAPQLGDSPWHEYLLVPVTAVYALTTFVVAAPFLVVARMSGSRLRDRLRDSEVGGFVWRLWILAAPHAVTLALFATVHELAVRAWFGGSFLVMLSADVATLATGDPHSLRRPIQARLPKLP